MRPTSQVLKALLKHRHLNEVFTGGLSSYSLLNMVVAHLQADGGGGGDLGRALLSFLERYGRMFDYVRAPPRARPPAASHSPRSPPGDGR